MLQNKTTDKESETVNRSNTNSDDIYISPPTGTSSYGFIIPTNKQTNESFDVPRKSNDILDITPKTWEYINKGQNKDQIKQVIKLLGALRNLLKGYDDLGLPKIRISLAEDESIALSWHVGTAYFGASIQQNITESSWFLIQGDARGYKADGYLGDPDFEAQLPSMLNLLIKSHIQQR